VVVWFTARRTLAKVEAVTNIAANISVGSLDSRVPLTPASDEIDRLSTAFNNMLDRIQMLLTNLREVTDNLAHELRSPVTRIRGGAETTLTGSENLADYKSMTASTIEECDHLLTLINTTLDISEAEAGVVKLKPADFDLAKVVRDMCDLFRPVAEDKVVAIREEIPAACQVRADREKIQRSLANLLDNAIKYSHANGSVTVVLREAETHILITVKDTGIGISSQDLPRIFERFYRSDASRSEPGNGLGLSLARALVRAHGGDITVESVLGAGSTFVVALPR
jgi:signal transduction histidine kinase